MKRKNYGISISGFIGRGEIEFANQLIDDYYQNNPRNVSNDFGDFITMGIYENNYNGNPELFEYYNVIPEDSNVIRGLAAGGHLRQLMDFVISDPKTLSPAISLARKNVIDYYDLVNTYNWPIGFVVSFGHLFLLPNVDNVSKLKLEIILNNLIGDGYLEKVVEYSDIITNNTIKNTLNACLTNNHIDVVDYLLTLRPETVKKAIFEEFSTSEITDKYAMTMSSWKYLLNNNLITLDQINNIPRYIRTIMSNINKDAFDYLLSIITAHYDRPFNEEKELN